MIAEIEVIFGGMFSGKTSELMRIIRNHTEYARQTSIVFKHSLDCTRYSKDLCSHDGKHSDCIPVSTVSEMYLHVNNLDKIDVIGVEEAQFFGKDILNFVDDMSLRCKKIIVAGLDMTYLGEPFGSMGDLACVADKVTKLHAICVDCGAEATHSYRKTDNKEIIVVGGQQEYIALCRDCFKKRLEI